MSTAKVAVFQTQLTVQRCPIHVWVQIGETAFGSPWYRFPGLVRTRNGA